MNKVADNDGKSRMAAARAKLIISNSRSFNPVRSFALEG